MKISLDYDKTFTEDPGFWTDFIHSAMNRGHDIMIVTYRNPAEKIEHEEELLNWCNCKTYYSARRSKRDYMESLGIKIDVWIDDMPEVIVQDSDWTDAQYEEWRKSKGYN